MFAKPVDYDPRIDPSLRVEIGRLRTRLNEFYVVAGAAPVRIDIPKGSYVPVFEAPAAEQGPPAIEPQPPPVRRVSRPLLLAVLGVLAAALLLWRILPRENGINSVVVLPFANLTGDPHNDYLADGVTEQLTDALAQISGLRVVARTSAFQFKDRKADIREIGRQVNADTVIEGSLASVDGKLRLTVQLNRSRDGYHIYSRVFEGGLHDLVRLEQEMAAPVIGGGTPGDAKGRGPGSAGGRAPGLLRSWRATMTKRCGFSGRLATCIPIR